TPHAPPSPRISRRFRGPLWVRGPSAWRSAHRGRRARTTLRRRCEGVVLSPTMPGDHEAELKIAVAEGILPRSEAEALGEEARRLERRPLRLLVERGRLSEESL